MGLEWYGHGRLGSQAISICKRTMYLEITELLGLKNGNHYFGTLVYNGWKLAGRYGDLGWHKIMRFTQEIHCLKVIEMFW